MLQLLTLSRAARLVGVTRSALQKRIQNDELSTFEGQVAITDLLRAYPDTQMEDTSMLDRVERIKTEAMYDRRADHQTALPSPEILAARLATLSKELISVKSELNNYLELVETLAYKLNEIEKRDDISALQDWLTTERQRTVKPIMEPAAQLLAKDTLLRIMAAHVKMIPSGHEFWVEGADSILDAALQAGLAINYGCTSGNCGLCKARIVSGEVQKTRHHDYVISETEKNMGYQLMCCHTPITDLIIEAAEAHRVEDIPLQQIETKVKKLEHLTNDLLVLHLQTPRTKTLRFFAGQTVTLTLKEHLSADYFIASCPCDGRHLEFHLHRISNDPFTETFFNQVKIGQSLNLEGPKGHFVLQEDSTRPVLFLTYSHGFAPIKSLIEHAIALDTVAAFHLYWIAPHERGHYQNNQCRAWTDALDNFQYTALTADGGDKNQLKMTLMKVVADYPYLNDFEVYITGPQSFIAVAEEILYQHHLPESQCHKATIDQGGLAYC